MLMPVWLILLLCVVPIAVYFYFSRKAYDLMYDSKPIVCNVCGKHYSQFKKVINGSSSVTCPHCGTIH